MTADAWNHPEAQHLRAFAAGALGDDNLDRIAEHLDVCEDCRAAVDGLLVGDGFLDRLRTATTLGGDVPEGQAERRRAARALGREVLRSARARPAQAGEGPSPPGEVGRYVVLAEVGRGGMGVVYQARHRDLHRMVALKMILAGEFASELQRLRFRREAELAARVQHPHIVQVYEVGLHDGRPFLAMEWVAGGTLADRLGGDPWPPQAAAGLVESLARALEVAHRKGVIHRDLKPSNILLQTDAGAAAGGPLAGAIPKVADFGMARAMDGDASLTATGMAVGTPEYMAPEQAAGDEAGPAADIYALGAILYRVLTGQPPFRGDSPMEVLQALASAEPIAPRRFRPGLARDLETIVLKAMAREPRQRYATAEALAEDLRRHLADEPIQARPPSPLDRLRKFARRNKALVGGVIATLTALVLGLVTTIFFAVGEARQRSVAEHNAREARSQAYRARLGAATMALSMHDVEAAAHQLKDVPAELRGWEWRHLHARLDDRAAAIPLPRGGFGSLLAAPDRLRVAVVTDGGGRLEDLEGGPTEMLPILPNPWHLHNVAQTRHGLRVVAGLGQGTFAVLDPAGRELCRGEVPRIKGFAYLFLSGDSARLAGYWDDREGLRLGVFDATSGRLTTACDGPIAQLRAITFSADGARLAAAGEDSTTRVWDAATGALLATCQGHTSTVHGVTFRPDGKRLATASADGTVRQWEIASGREVEPPYEHHTGEVVAVAYSPDGTWVASAGMDRTVRLWRAKGRQDVAVLHGHTGVVTDLAFAPDGSRLASLSYATRLVNMGGDGTARVWDLDPRTSLPELRGHERYVYPVAYTADGRLIASGSWDGTVRLWDAATGEAVAVLPQGGIVRALTLSPDGQRLVAMGDESDGLRVWDVATGRRIATYKTTEKKLWAIAYRPGGAHVAVLGPGHVIEVLDATTGERVATADAGARLEFWAHRRGLAYSPDGRLLAGPYEGNGVGLWEADTYRLVGTLTGHEGTVLTVAFNANGRLLASGGADSLIKVWDVASRDCRLTLPGHTDEVFAAVFHPDGSRIASGGRDRLVRLWDAATGEELVRLPGHTDYVYSLAFSPDGKTLVSGSGDDTVRLWDTAPLKARYQARREAEALRPEAERLVESSWRQKSDPADIVESLGADRTLSEPLRQAALRAVLRRALPTEAAPGGALPVRGSPRDAHSNAQAK